MGRWDRAMIDTMALAKKIARVANSIEAGFHRVMR